MAKLTVADINQYSGTTINPPDNPDEVYELYSVPSFDSQYPEIIKGSEIGSSKITVEDGDVLVCKINPRINRVWVVKHHTDHPLLASSEWIVVRNSKMDSNYLKWYFSSPTFRNLLVSQVAGIGGSLTRAQPKQVAKYPVPIVDICEQRRIAAVLNKVSGLIAKRREQLDKLDELVKARFVEMFGDPINNTKGLPTTPLGEICYLKAGVTTISDEIHSQSKEYSVPCYGGNGIRGYVKEATQRGTYPIIGRQGALCGNVQLAIGEFHATEHAVLVSPIIKTNVIWVYYLLKFMDLYRYHTGAAQPGLAVKTLNMVEIPCADIGLQNEYATFAEQVEKSKLTIQQSLDKLELLKKALMQQYFG